MSSVPCQTDTGTVMSLTEKPQGRSIVRSSSCQPDDALLAGTPERRRDELGQVTGQRGAVDRGSQGAQRVGDIGGGGREDVRREVLEQSGQRLRARPIAAVNSATFSSPMPARRSPSYSACGTRPDAADRGEAAVGEHRGAGQGPGTAAGPADADELAEPEVVEDHRDVGGVVGDRGGGGAVGAPGGAAVPGAGAGDHPQPALGGGVLQHRRRVRRPAGVPWWKTRGKPSSGPETRTSRSRPSGAGTCSVMPSR